MAECPDDDLEQVRVGEDQVAELFLGEPGEIVVLFGCPVLGLSGPRVDHEDPGVVVSSRQPPEKTSLAGRDHDPKLFSHLTGESFEV
jgi:hypothetical protein